MKYSTRCSRPTSLTERSNYVRLWVRGMSSRAIALETGTSVTTVCRWIKRWREEGHVNTRPRCGRPEKVPRIILNNNNYFDASSFFFLTGNVRAEALLRNVLPHYQCLYPIAFRIYHEPINSSPYSSHKQSL